MTQLEFGGSSRNVGEVTKLPERGPEQDVHRPGGKREFAPLRSVKIATARYSNKQIVPSGLTPVRITRYHPRFPLPYKPVGVIELAPSAALLNGAKGGGGREAFEAGFNQQLAALDPEQIGARLYDVAGIATGGKGIVLLCFEDLRKGGGIYCHRTQVARWLEATYGVTVEELAE